MPTYHIKFEPEEAKAILKLLDVLTFEDVIQMLARHEKQTTELSEKAYEVWSVFDDLHRSLLGLHNFKP